MIILIQSESFKKKKKAWVSILKQTILNILNQPKICTAFIFFFKWVCQYALLIVECLQRMSYNEAQK